MNHQEPIPESAIPLFLRGYQREVYRQYVSRGMVTTTAEYLASLFGRESPAGGIISNPEVYVRNHPSALLAMMDFLGSTGIADDFFEKMEKKIKSKS